jgi:hypothetical protein
MSIISKAKYHVSNGIDWEDFQETIRNGQCVDISKKAFDYLTLHKVPAKWVSGFIRYPSPVISNDIHEEETTELRHWWVEIEGSIFEFAKGTLVNGVVSRYPIDCGNMECVSKPVGFEYFPERYLN